MKIVIIGAGAIGKLFSGLLKKGGNEVTIIDKDPSIIHTIKEQGIDFIKIKEGNFEVHDTISLQATTESQDIKHCDLLILAVKSYDTQEAVKTISHLVTDQSPLLTLQTGIDIIEKISTIIEPKNIIGGLTNRTATSLRGFSVQLGGEGITLIGDIDQGKSERVRQIRKTFEQSNIQTSISDNIMGNIWAKGIIFSAINSLTAILKIKNGELLRDEKAISLARRIIKEGKSVAEKLDITLPADDLFKLFSERCEKAKESLSSMLQDILNGRQTEIDALNGAIYRLGARKGISTPTNQTLMEIISLMQK